MTANSKAAMMIDGVTRRAMHGASATLAGLALPPRHDPAGGDGRPPI